MHRFSKLKNLADFLKTYRGSEVADFEESMYRASIGRLYYHAFHLSSAFLRSKNDPILLYSYYLSLEGHDATQASQMRMKALHNWKEGESKLESETRKKSIHTRVENQLGTQGNATVQQAFKNLKRFRHRSDYAPLPTVTESTVELAYDEYAQFFKEFQKLV